MAEFLIKAVDATHSDPVKDQRGCYKRGDIVQVYEDGTCTEPPSPNSKMVLVKVTGITKAQAEKYLRPYYDETNPMKPVMLRRRLYWLRMDDVPLSIKQALKTDRRVTVPIDQAKSYIRNKVTNLDEA